MSEDCFTYTRTIAFGECDSARVLYTPRAVDFAVEAVESWFDEIVGVSWSELVTVHRLEATILSMECDYLKPMTAGQTIRVQLRVVDGAAGLLTVSALAERGPRELVFRVRFEICLSSLADRAAVAIPAPFRESIRLYRLHCGDQIAPDSAAGPERETPGQSAFPPAPRQDAEIPFSRKRRISYGECGLSGTMYLPRLIECAVERVGEWYHSCLGISWLDQCVSGKGVPFVNIRCDSLRPLRAGETVRMLVRVPRLGTASIGYQVVGYDDEGVPCFSLRLAGCYITECDGAYSVLPFPEEMRGRIREYQKSC